MKTPRIVVTSGEPAGIGPDICIALAARNLACELVVAGDARLLREAADALGVNVSFKAYESRRATQESAIDRAAPAPEQANAAAAAAQLASASGMSVAPCELTVLDVPLERPVIPGRLDAANSAYVLQLLNRACDGCLSGEFAAVVTAPVQKSIIMQAGFEFSGHTEYLAQRCGAPLPVMMLAARTLRVALVTTHLALADVPRAITRERLAATLEIVHADLQRLFGLTEPRILVLGLNPHAGESGYLGREEIDVITPVLRELAAKGMRIEGPVPADTAFTPARLESADVVVAMYHDQGLPVLKYAGFGDAVNVTLGLPIVRTSVDHGTALDLARSGRAEAGSLIAAVELAVAAAQRSAFDGAASRGRVADDPSRAR